jgi:hypothetical protein
MFSVRFRKRVFVLSGVLSGLLMLSSAVSHAYSPIETVDVPQTDLSIASQDELGPRVPGKTSTFDISLSSWSPLSFMPSSAGAGASAPFHDLLAPTIGGTYYHRVASHVIFQGGTVSLLGGLEFSLISRDGVATLDGFSIPASQTLCLFPARVGVEYAVATRYLIPHVSAALMPTMALIPRSSIDDGSTEFGLGYAFDAGISTPARFIGPGATLGLDLRVTAGSLDSGSLYGTGIEADLRFPI